MKNVTWAIQTNLINDIRLNQMWYAVQEAGANVQELVVLPFTDDFDNEIPDLDGHVIPYGSTKMIKLSQKYKWDGLFFDENTFKVDVWLSNNHKMLNKNSLQMKVKDIFEKFKDVDDNEDWFIRPLRDLKEFNGTVANVKEIKRWMNSVYSGNFDFSEDTDVVIAPVQKLYNECRFFIVNGKVVDGSIYRQNGLLRSLHIDDISIINQAQELADIWLPHRTCVMDIALTDEGFKIIEFNTFNCTGFYDNDVNKIVKAVTDSFGD